MPTTVTPQPVVLTPNEVAAELASSTDVVYDAIRRGTIRHVRLGRKILIPRDALDDFLAGT